ncbi:MAG: nucleotidyltransferase family protein [Dehalococcoidia bacterium]
MSVPTIVLAAGEGTRLRPLTLDRPKPMVPLAGRPALEWVFRWLRHHGVRNLFVNLHYRPEVIPRYFGDGSSLGLHISYRVEPDILGTAGGAAGFRDQIASTCLVVYGDVLSDLNVGELLARHRAASATATIALYRVPDPWTRGVVDLDPTGRVTRFREKPSREDCPSSTPVNAGIFAIEPAVFDLIPSDGPSDFGRDIFPALLAAGLPVHGWESGAYVLDYGTIAQHEQADADARAGRVRLY